MSVLVLAELNQSNLVLDTTARVVNAAKALGDVTLLCLGENLSDAVASAATIDGVSQVLAADSPLLGQRLAEPCSALISGLEGYQHIVAAASSDGKNLLPRVAALLDVMIISDVIAIDSPDTFQRPIYAGNAIQTVQSRDAVKVLTVRAASFEPATTGPAAAVQDLAAVDLPSPSTWVENKVSANKGPELSSAKTIVSGGRAVGSQENFAIIQGLAEKLNAAVGASRAAVDAGYAPNDWQVGQTGKVVAPDLYVACGISGAIQHLAGMKDSKVIVAINSDPDAPIFQVADYGLVGDLFDVVPKLTEAL